MVIDRLGDVRMQWALGRWRTPAVVFKRRGCCEEPTTSVEGWDVRWEECATDAVRRLTASYGTGGRLRPGHRAEVDRFFRVAQVHSARAHYPEVEMSQEPINILSVEQVGDYRLRLHFDNGAEQTVDFYTFLSRARHPEIRAFLDPARFAAYHIEHGDLVWGDYALCFPIIDLYRNRARPPNLWVAEGPLELECGSLRVC